MKKFKFRSFSIPVWLIVLVVALIGIRAALPSIIKGQINHVLQTKLDRYTGEIRDFDLLLIAGTYFIEDFSLRRKDAPAGHELIHVKKAEVDLSWRALMHGRVLLDVKLEQPQIRLNAGEMAADKKFAGEKENRTTVKKALLPFDVQTLEIADGSFHFLRPEANPKVDVVLDQIDAKLQNIGNILKTRDGELPSAFNVSALAQKHARLLLSGRGQFLADPIALQADVDLRSFELKSLNPFFKSYGFFDVTQGEVSTKGRVFATWPALDMTFLTTLKKVDVVAPKQKFKGARGLATELVLALTNLVVRDRNESEDTELHLTGNWPDLKLDKWRAVKTLVN